MIYKDDDLIVSYEKIIHLPRIRFYCLFSVMHIVIVSTNNSNESYYMVCINIHAVKYTDLRMI